MPDNLPEVLEAERLGRSGRVVAEATVTPAGTLTDISILTSSGLPKLDAGIITALKTWRLSSPVDKNGVKVSTRAKFPFAIGGGPARLSGPEFSWPPGAREAFHNGKVTVSFTIGVGGMPADVKVSRSSGSSLLDGALVAAVGASHYAVPAALDGTPTPFNAAMTWEFSQANGGSGSYLEGLSKYSCATFVGEHDWRVSAVPAAQLNDTEFYHFMAGAVFLSPESFGWKNVTIYDANKRHAEAWQHALERCRANPASKFLVEYKKG
ncbi:MAG: energy transducer TonB [Novosphingobium sp.]